MRSPIRGTIAMNGVVKVAIQGLSKGQETAYQVLTHSALDRYDLWTSGGHDEKFSAGSTYGEPSLH